jgi:hypothetical protein
MRKLVLLFLLVLAAALGLAVLFQQKFDLPVFYLTLLSDACLGLVAGFGARFVLVHRHGLLRGLAATATLFIGLAVLGYFTNWSIGIGPLVFWPSTPDWVGASQWGIGTGVALLALLAWHYPVRGVVTPPAQAAQPKPRKQRRAPAAIVPHNQTRTVGRRAIHPKSGARRTKTGGKAQRGQTSSYVHAGISFRSKRDVARAARLKRTRANLFHRRAQVQLALVEEHRCPYCLEPVKRNDPRGVKECEVCHTLHHADCWAITGSCQVPHYNG